MRNDGALKESLRFENLSEFIHFKSHQGFEMQCLMPNYAYPRRNPCPRSPTPG